MSGLVSVIMPVFNGEKYVAAALQSVVDQTYPDWELIVVDDGSTDATPTIVAAAQDARIRYVRQENRGQAAALNHGLDLVNGAYVTTLDADDRFTPGSLLDRVRWLETHADIGAVYADGYLCNAELEPRLRFSQNRPGNVTGDIYPALINTPLFGTGACVMIRTAVLQQWRLRYDDAIVMCQDWDFYIRVAAHAQYGYVDAISVFYRVHPENMTLTVGRERHINAIIRTRLKVIESDRFGALGSAEKREFLRRMLVNTLAGRPEDQESVIRSSRFRELAPADRATLLRWLAAEWLLDDTLGGRAQHLLQEAQSLAPSDPKTAGLVFLVRRAPALARYALWGWRSLRPCLLHLRSRIGGELRRVKLTAAGSWR